MKQNKKDFTLKGLIRECDRESTLILLLVPVVLTLWVYLGKQEQMGLFFRGLSERWNADFYSTLFENLSAFVFMFVIPLIFLTLTLKKKLGDYGFRWGDKRFGFRFFLIGAPIILFFVWLGSADPSVQAEYPMAKSAMGNMHLFAIAEFSYLIYYIGWESLFRGIMIFGLEKRLGAVAAILIQTIPSALVHIGKPFSESFGAILVGLIFGYLAIRSRSILYPLMLHALVGIPTDIFVTLRIM